MNNKIVKKYNIRIPQDVSVIYSKTKRTLTFLGPLKTKSLKLQVQIFINKSQNIINVSPLPFSQRSNTEKKKTRIVRNTVVAAIKYMLIESSILLSKKLNINGVGYRYHFTENFDKNLLTFKLGYSHLVYIRTLDELSINYLTKTKLCIFGNSYANITQFAAQIRNNKAPEPYKSKGILYENEKVERKEGKKI